jgi:hypothetical protein
MRRRQMALVLALGLVAAACSGGPIGGDGGGGGGGGGGSTTTQLRVENGSGTTVYRLRVSPCSVSSWGPDQLGSNVIGSGSAYTLNSIPCPQCYDLRAEDSSGNTLAESRGNAFTCGRTAVWRIN